MGAMSLPLSGWRVVVTGDVPGMTRDAAQEAVRMMGGTAASSVTPSTDLLVVGKGAGASKLAKAADLGSGSSRPSRSPSWPRTPTAGTASRSASCRRMRTSRPMRRRSGPRRPARSPGTRRA